MKKFTVFTIILTVIVVVVFGEMIVNEYFPGFGDSEKENTELTLPENLAKSTQGNVLGSDLGGIDKNERSAFDNSVIKEKLVGNLPVADETELVEEEAPVPSEDLFDLYGFEDDFKDKTEDAVSAIPESASRTDGLKDFEDEDFISATNTVYLREEHIKSAGFLNAYLESEPFDNRLFKSILVDDLNDVEITKTAIRTKDLLLTKVYIFKAGIDSNINEIYQLLRLRASQGLGVQTNETNEYGLASFYINDPNRSTTAFLVVRISGLIYGFSYPKEFHPQIKNLIKLIEWELG